MIEASKLQLIIDFNDFDLDDDGKDELRQELEELAGIDTEPPIGRKGKAIGSILTGILMAEVNPANLTKLFTFLSDRLGNKPIKLKLKTPDGRELEIEASSKEEIEYAIAQAEKFIKQQ
ncbi:hypothetical protein [Brunnivagina elsteri]|uniref:Uncharacterized protein n=1 Tax=Brunnivagina elsteri CCALA 953 TaxID=987040 RepID=A0A2A2TG27_9CYAN|nr:hypothetical protein [Calothrix elsteri]PAX52682.1 hypothetical protein CK510_17965 [Calothrix elsteri CCALA 953]